ncbi:MerR family transcriptional regulator [Synergistaceae bacterium OttesenSCG-928-I11]|nr:MerR family transcriptional regulator [Synergistaceae bacterium OttesenSCG-928-I11]
MTISEVCEKFALSQDTLRYYEKIGLLPRVQKNSGGFREFAERDCERIAMIKWMRDAGMSIKTLTQYIDMVPDGDKTIEARKKLLLELKNQLTIRINELQVIQRLLDEKIECYEIHIAPKEEELFPRQTDQMHL